MCPACLASAAWVVGGAVSTGGLTAMVAKVLKKNAKNDSNRRSEDHGNSDEQQPGNREGGSTD